VRLSRGELAELVGAATESVIRFLTDFKRAGVLSLRGKRIGILELETLHDVANVEIHGTVPQRQESDEDREPVCAEAA